MAVGSQEALKIDQMRAWMVSLSAAYHWASYFEAFWDKVSKSVADPFSAGRAPPL